MELPTSHPQMRTADAEAPAAADEHDLPVILSQTLRRAGRRGTRVLAVLSLLLALGAVGYVLSTTQSSSPPSPLAAATSGAWRATGALSDALRELRPGGSRTAARPLAGRAARAVARARRRVGVLSLPSSKTPARDRVLTTLHADAAWIGAVGATLADPGSPRRARLSRLASAAATATDLTARDVHAANGTVGGTGRLLSATRGG